MVIGPWLCTLVHRAEFRNGLVKPCVIRQNDGALRMNTPVQPIIHIAAMVGRQYLI